MLLLGNESDHMLVQKCRTAIGVLLYVRRHRRLGIHRRFPCRTEIVATECKLLAFGCRAAKILALRVRGLEFQLQVKSVVS